MFSFTARKKTVDLQRYTRRLIDLTIPNKPNAANSERSENRDNRALPALACPWEEGAPIISQSAFVITKDLSDRGIGLILNHPFQAKSVAVGFCLATATGSEPWFFLGATQANVEIGGGFWLLCVELSEFMNDEWGAQLAPLFRMAYQLLPPVSSSDVDAGIAESGIDQQVARQSSAF